MKVDRGIILSSKELYALKKNNSNCSLILISLKCGTSVKNYLSNSFFPACILLSNKNKALYRFLYIFLIFKFVEIIIYCLLMQNTKISKLKIKLAYFYKKIGEIFYNLTCIIFFKYTLKY